MHVTLCASAPSWGGPRRSPLVLHWSQVYLLALHCKYMTITSWIWIVQSFNQFSQKDSLAQMLKIQNILWELKNLFLSKDNGHNIYSEAQRHSSHGWKIFSVTKLGWYQSKSCYLFWLQACANIAINTAYLWMLLHICNRLGKLW